MSRVFYKFRSAKDYDAYRLEGAADGVAVWELKREIVAAKRLSRATDFDLVLANAQTGEQYADDGQVVPRNAQVVVRRVPVHDGNRRLNLSAVSATSWRPPPGAGITGLAGVSRPGAAPAGDAGEEARLRAVMAAGASQWEQNAAATAESQAAVEAARLAARASMVRSGAAARPWLAAVLPAPPEGYVCYRCGQRGHYIQHCPTNSDPAFDRARVRRTTGIPRSFLRPVERPDAAPGEDMPGVLVTPEGAFVVAAPNEQEWSRLTTLRSAIAASAAAVPEADVPDDLRCAACRGLLQAAVALPCCGAALCDECVVRVSFDARGSAGGAAGDAGPLDAVFAALQGSARELQCPVCARRVLASRVEPDAPRRARVRAFLDARASSDAAAARPDAAPRDDRHGRDAPRRDDRHAGDRTRRDDRHADGGARRDHESSRPGAVAGDRPSRHTHDDRRSGGHADDRRSGGHGDDRRPGSHGDDRRPSSRMDDRRPGAPDEYRRGGGEDHRADDGDRRSARKRSASPRRPDDSRSSRRRMH